MSTPYTNEVHSYMSYKWNIPNQLSNLHSCRTLSDSKMAPTVDQEKNTRNGDLVAEHPEEQYTSTETSSSDNNSDVQPDNLENVNKLSNRPTSSSPSNINNSPRKCQVPGSIPPPLFGNGQMTVSLYKALYGPADKPVSAPVTNSGKLLFDGLYCCLKCDFVGRNDDELHEHALRHDPYECGSCGFLADTQANLKVHLKSEHPEITPKSWRDNILFHGAVDSASAPKKKCKEKSCAENFLKQRKTKCNICHIFVGDNKMEYYDHLKKEHESTGRLLRCNLCPFIALYKHHLEYHFRNHYGSKPYKCDRCDYSCVNRSMLNSHYKSHSDIYQYSCKNCSYMTKYLHSLKMHLRKYNHEPGRTLNPDGSVNSNTIIDVHGKRRGPKSKKRKSEVDLSQESSESPKSKSSPSPPSTSQNQPPPQNIRILYNPQIYNNYTGNLYVSSEPSEASNNMLPSPPNTGGFHYINCGYCDFRTVSYEMYRYHMYSHANQNQPSTSNFSPSFPYFVPNIGSLFPSPYGAESFPKNGLNQSTAVEKKSIAGNGNMNATNNDFYLQNSSNAMKCGPFGNAFVDKKESAINGMAIPPKTSPYAFQYPANKFKEHSIKYSPLPHETLTATEEVPETMHGFQMSLAENDTDDAPLDLSLKQPVSQETKSNQTFSSYPQFLGAAMDRTPSVSPKSENESKVTIRKANRRKGRAFKLNQYTVESDPVSDGIETEFGKMRVFGESPHSNETHPKPSFRSEIKKSVPRINFKPTLNTAKWNGHSSHESTQPEFQFNTESSNITFNTFGADVEPDEDAPSTKITCPSDSWCSKCFIDQGSPHLLEVHSSYHSKDDPFTCAKCGLACHNKTGFLIHILSGSRINGMCINTIQ